MTIHFECKNSFLGKLFDQNQRSWFGGIIPPVRLGVGASCPPSTDRELPPSHPLGHTCTVGRGGGLPQWGSGADGAATADCPPPPLPVTAWAGGPHRWGRTGLGSHTEPGWLKPQRWNFGTVCSKRIRENDLQKPHFDGCVELPFEFLSNVRR